jgi:hypothetical protein
MRRKIIAKKTAMTRIVKKISGTILGPRLSPTALLRAARPRA